jgi:hypothetical protein
MRRMPEQTWASRRIRLLRALLPAAGAVTAVVLAVRSAVDPEPGAAFNPGWVFAAFAVAAVALTVRARRVAVTLGPDAVVVRNPIRTYTVPYAEIDAVRDGWLDLVSQTAAHLYGSRVVTLLATDRWTSEVTVEATAWLPAPEYDVLRAELTARVREHRGTTPADSDTDTRPPYAAVLRLLEDLDPEGYGATATRDSYELEADELATVLRSRRVTADDVTELWRDLYGDDAMLSQDAAAEAFAARLNAL